MKIYAQTVLSPVLKVYDSTGQTTNEDTGLLKLARKIINPVVQVEESGVTLYKSGEFYQPYAFYGIMLVLGLSLGYFGIKKLLK